MSDRTHALKVVFTASRAGELETSTNKVTITSQSLRGAISPLGALATIVKTLRILGEDPKFVQSGKSVTAETLLKIVEKKGRWEGHLETEGLYLQYGVVGAYEQCFVSVREKTPEAAGDWDKWAEAFIGQIGFVQAWLVDVDYDHWQNAKNPLQYQAAHREFSHLPMRSNGHPPPLESLEIDISRNPGRWEFRSGYIESIGATMWLSDIFWEKVGKLHKNQMIKNDWLEIREVGTGVLRIQVSDQYFDSERTADIQLRLRDTIFGLKKS